MKNIIKFSIAFICTFAFSTMAQAQCDTPTGLSETNITNNSAELSWNAVAGADHYRVRYRIGNELWNYETAASNSHDLLGLNPGTNYKWEARAFCSADETIKSNWSSSSFFQTTGGTSCDIPLNRNSGSVTFSSATLTWDADPNALDYRVRYRFGNDWFYETAPTNSFDLTDLLVGTEYRWQVRSICSPDEVSKSQWSPTEFFTTAECTNNLTSLVSSNIMDDEATLTWDAVAGDGYEVALTVQGSDVWDTVFVATNSYNPTGLYSGTDYKWEVALVCDLGNDVVSNFTISTTGDEHEFTTTGPIACPAPTNLNASGISNDEADLSWTVESAAETYDIQYRVVGAANWIEVPTPDNGTDITITGLFSGMEYEARVRSVCTIDHALVGRFTSKLKFNTTGPVACETPTNLSTTSIGNNQATTNWDPVTGGLEYKVRYRPNNSNEFITVGTANTPYNLTMLPEDTEHRWQVRAICNADTSLISVSSSFQFFTTTGVGSCVVPTGLTVDMTDNTTADLSWGAVAGAVSYNFRYKNGNNPWNYTSSATNSINLTGLSQGITYDWEVKAVCSELNQSAWSTHSTFTTTGTAACEVPTGLSADGITSTEATLNWTEATTATRGYRVRYRVANGSYIYVATSESSSDNSYMLSTLAADTEYQWQVRSLCDGSVESDWSTQDSFTTSPMPMARQEGSSATARKNASANAKTEAQIEESELYLWSDFEVIDNQNGILELTFNGEVGNYRLNIFNLEGQLVYTKDGANQRAIEFDKSFVGKDKLYIFKVTDAKGVKTKKYLLK